MFLYNYTNAVNVIFNYIVEEYIFNQIIILWLKLNKGCFCKKIGWNSFIII